MSMTSVNGDFDERLRRALHAEVDSVEPATDGLERILYRARQPWLLRQVSLMLTECADLFWLIVIRLEPVAGKLRQAIASRTGLLAAPAGRRHASPGRRARPGSELGWLRPALAVSAAVIVVVAGVYGLAQLRQSLVLDLFPNADIPASTGSATSGQSGGSVQGHTSPGLLPTGGPVSATPSASATCTKAAKKKHGRTPSTSPSPTPTGTPTETPTPTPTPSVTSTSTATTAAYVASASDLSLAAHCASARAS
jgi:hypothetical protein